MLHLWVYNCTRVCVDLCYCHMLTCRSNSWICASKPRDNIYLVTVAKYHKLCDFFQRITARHRWARAEYTRAEEKHWEFGVRRFSHQWTKILRSYKFHSQSEWVSTFFTDDFKCLVHISCACSFQNFQLERASGVVLQRWCHPAGTPVVCGYAFLFNDGYGDRFLKDDERKPQRTVRI